MWDWVNVLWVALTDFVFSFGPLRLLFWLAAIGWVYWFVRSRRLAAKAGAPEFFLHEEYEKPAASMTQMLDRVAQKVREHNFFVDMKYLLVGVVSVVVITYVSFFAFRSPFSNSPAEWGQMGDFFGGMLNPILAFASFIALLYTIKLQSQEMSEARKELMASRIAQENLVEQAKTEHESQGKRERYSMLLSALTQSNDLIKSLLDKPFSKANPNAMPEAERCVAEVAKWAGRENAANTDHQTEKPTLNKAFEEYISASSGLFRLILNDVKPILSECRRLKVIAEDFEKTCLEIGAISNESVDIVNPANFEQLMIKDAALNLKRARLLSETFDCYTLESFTPKPKSLLDKFGRDSD